MTDRPGQKLAIVTGASKGIGRAVCVELARCGFFIIINYRSDQSGASETLRIVEAQGTGGEIMQFDVADYDATQAAVSQIICTSQYDRRAGEQCRHHGRPAFRVDVQEGMAFGY